MEEAISIIGYTQWYYLVVKTLNIRKNEGEWKEISEDGKDDFRDI